MRNLVFRYFIFLNLILYCKDFLVKKRVLFINNNVNQVEHNSKRKLALNVLNKFFGRDRNMPVCQSRSTCRC